MYEEVETPIGVVTVECDADSVDVSFVPNSGVPALSVEGHTVTFSQGVKPPAKNSEITQNGSTFEVLDVRPNGSGYDVLNGNTKVWEKWLGD